MLSNKSEDIINRVIFDRACGKLDRVRHLLEAKLAFERLKEATIFIII